jgi:hypothetical protein
MAVYYTFFNTSNTDNHLVPLFMYKINTLNAELNPTCHLLALLGAHPILHINMIRVKLFFVRNHLVFSFEVCSLNYE